MTKEHKLRVACAGLRDQDRMAVMTYLSRYPKLLDKAVEARLRGLHYAEIERSRRQACSSGR